MHPKGVERMASSVDPDQTAPMRISKGKHVPQQSQARLPLHYLGLKMFFFFSKAMNMYFFDGKLNFMKIDLNQISNLSEFNV